MAKKKFNLEAYKSSIKANSEPLKSEKFIELHPCLHEIIGMPGLAQGHISQIYGKSDTGKTTFMFHTIAQCQKQGILPIVIITEGKVDWDRAALMGVNKEEAIIEEGLEYIEEMYDFMQRRITDMMNGDLPTNICFFWDSLGNSVSELEEEKDKDGYVVKKKGMQVAARAHSNGLRSFSRMINNTRKHDCPFFASALLINTGYNKPPTFPGGPTTYVPYGGESPWFKSSLILKTTKKAKLEATKDKKRVNFGINTRISVEKNHINGVSLKGDFAITADEILPMEKQAIADYKERNKDTWGDLAIYQVKEGEQ